VTKEHLYKGCALPFIDQGRGNRVIFFLHGYGSCAAEWKSQVAHFKDGARCLALDLPAHGDAGLPHLRDAKLRFLCDAVDDFLSREAGRNVVGVGHSLGGRILGKVALARPGLFAGLVLVNAPADQPLPLSLKLLTRFTPPRLAGLLMSRPGIFKSLTNKYSYEMVREPNKYTREKSELLRAMRKKEKFRPHMAYIAALGRDILKDRLWTQLGELKLPILAAWADKDHTCPLSSGELIARCAPNCKLVVFKNCSHNPHLEQFDAFNDAVDEFIRGLPGS
jgi:pimeloyl-ACP methyl ester carboxylesterase